MKVAYFQERFPLLTQTFVCAEISEWIRKGAEVRIYARKVNYDSRFNSLSFEVDWTTPDGIAQLKKWIYDFSPDYLHAHFVNEALESVLLISNNFGIPFGFTVHAYDIWKRGARLEPESFRDLTRQSKCLFIACEGSYHKEYLTWCGVPSEKILITPNAVDPSFLPKPRQFSPTTIKNIIVIGRPVPKKGFFIAIDAMRLLAINNFCATLTIVGLSNDDSLASRIIEEASKFDFINCEPLCSYSDVLKKIQASDVLIASSITAEDGDMDGIPTVLVEAMLLGVPVVASDVGSIKDLVKEGQTGFLARPGDPVDLANKILKLSHVLLNENSSNQLIEAAKKQASSHLSNNSIVTLTKHLESCGIIGFVNIN